MATSGSFQQPLHPAVLGAYNYSNKYPQTSEWSPPARDRRSSASLPGSIRRIRQACTNCRHRKIKCSGEKPSCVNCRKVDRPELLNRIKTIEAQLAQLTSQGAATTDKGDEQTQKTVQPMSMSDKSPRNDADGNNGSESSDSPGSAQSFQPSTETS
ncbi:hypothetical protein SEUCBS140593_009996 [Sporothrix eucalyptigena]|uniref:Zn(2)-C6 fungal-type domain-containing protein n=1 Tax=Sporothrix eucalyptigena TaxID=1812306 RepID=A0ABP0CZF3_9PEZI